MARFGPKVTGDTEKLFDHEDKPPFTEDFLKEILAAKDFSTAYRQSRPILMNYLCDRDNLQTLFNLLRTSPNRDIHKQLVPLFQTSNLEMTKFFAYDLPLTEVAFQVLDQIDEPTHAYGAATISRMLSRALHRWPEDCGDLFRASDTLFPLIIKHLDHPMVFQCIVDVLDPTHHEIIDLMWCIFRALSPDYKVTPQNLPRKLQFVKTYKLPTNLTTAHKLNAAELLKTFGGLGIIEFRDFNTHVLNWISTLTDPDPVCMSAYLRLAVGLGFHPAVKARALDVLRKLNPADIVPAWPADMSVTTGWFSYLGTCAPALDAWIAAGVIAKALLALPRLQAEPPAVPDAPPKRDPMPDQFAMLAVGDIVKGFVASHPKEESQKFGEYVGAVIARAWNTRVVGHNDHITAATCIQAEYLLQGKKEKKPGDDDGDDDEDAPPPAATDQKAEEPVVCAPTLFTSWMERWAKRDIKGQETQDLISLADRKTPPDVDVDKLLELSPRAPS
jgi:hypothetical protein